jgi:trans-aconitate methyltransferase
MADGFDTGFGDVDPVAWKRYVEGWADRLSLGPESAVFEMGSGAGAFLLPLASRGCTVSGIDLSPALVEMAAQVMPEGSFAVGEALDVRDDPLVDVVVSFGVFLYFPTLDYASEVIAIAAAKARRAVALFDLPDIAHREAALAQRVASVGGPEAYAARYAGLDHQYYDRQWVESTMRDAGLERVSTARQDLPCYVNGAHRFNAWGWKPA